MSRFTDPDKLNQLWSLFAEVADLSWRGERIPDSLINEVERVVAEIDQPFAEDTLEMVLTIQARWPLPPRVLFSTASQQLDHLEVLLCEIKRTMRDGQTVPEAWIDCANVMMDEIGLPNGTVSKDVFADSPPPLVQLPLIEEPPSPGLPSWDLS